MVTGTDVSEAESLVEAELSRTGWHLAYGVRERLRHLPKLRGADQTRAARRFGAWRNEAVFARNGETLAAYLRHLGIDEDSFADLLGADADVLHDAFAAEPDYVEALRTSWLRWLRAGGEGAGGRTNDHQHSIDFSFLTAPLFADASQRIREHLEVLAAGSPSVHIEVDTLAEQLVRTPFQAITQMVMRTAVLELNVLRIEGQLDGATPEERYRDFTEKLRRPEYALPLLREYPVLADGLVRLAQRWAETRIEFATRLYADIDDITARLADPGTAGAVTEVSFGAGDTHRGGRSVGIVGFAGGQQVVYKPRSLAVERHFGDLLRWLNERGQQPALETFWTLDRQEYGWTQFVAVSPCRDSAELGRFYARQGAYLALLHALGATDFHLENLIAAGEHPMLVDLEALLHPWQPKPPERFDVPGDAIAAMRDSVLSVGLLPNPIVWNDEDGLGQADLSGLSGTAGQLTPVAVPIWDAIGKDDMHLIRRRVPMNGGSNLPSLNGSPVAALDYRRDLLDGFRATYRLLLEHREEVLAEDGPLAAFAQAEIRVIVRATRSYALLMTESYHPDLLRDAADRDRFLANLWSGHPDVPGREAIIECEIAELQSGDVPIFITTPDSVDLVSGTGTVIPGVLPQNGLARAAERLRSLSEADLVRQTWFVEASLAALEMAGESGFGQRPDASPGGLAPAPGRAGDAVRAHDPELMESAARRIGDRLLSLSLGTDSISWLGLNLIGERIWQLGPTGIDMFNGLGGMTLFLGYLGETDNGDRYRAAARRGAEVLATQIELIDQPNAVMAPRTAIGAFTGLGAGLYVLSHLSALWKDAELADRAARLLPHIARMTKDDTALDIISGAAGALLGVLALHAVRPSTEALAVADGLAAHLRAAAQWTGDSVCWPSDFNPGQPLAGYSHGASGIASALSRLDRVRADDANQDFVHAAIRFERTLFDPEIDNWRDVRSFVAADSNMVAWCHGAGGIGLARAELAGYGSTDPMVGEDVAAALVALLRAGLNTGNHCICHGDLGNAEAVVALGRHVGDATAVRAGLEAATAIAARVAAGNWICGVPLGVETPGLMPGLAGIGYNLLRLAQPLAVPSVLLLEAPMTGRLE